MAAVVLMVYVTLLEISVVDAFLKDLPESGDWVRFLLFMSM